jgi:hypothetical protein
MISIIIPAIATKTLVRPKDPNVPNAQNVVCIIKNAKNIAARNNGSIRMHSALFFDKKYKDLPRIAQRPMTSNPQATGEVI